jgi:hypothetical protein
VFLTHWDFSLMMLVGTLAGRKMSRPNFYPQCALFCLADP